MLDLCSLFYQKTKLQFLLSTRHEASIYPHNGDIVPYMKHTSYRSRIKRDSISEIDICISQARETMFGANTGAFVDWPAFDYPRMECFITAQP